MPYAPVSPSTSPTTVHLPSHQRTAEDRPPRHHMRSQSSDSLLPSPSSSFIFVQPASPGPEDRAGHARHHHSHHSTHHGSAVAGPSSGITHNKPRREKLFGFTPADASSDGPSSQEGSAQGDDSESQSEQPTSSIVAPTAQRPVVVSTAFSFGETSVPLVPIPVPVAFRPGHVKSASDYLSPSLSQAAHAKSIKSSFSHRKTAMVRKKSGELVRSSLKPLATLDEPSSRRAQARSEPATPTCKYVHFDTQLEHVKHFLAQQRPAAVSRSGSPVETETEDEPEAFPFPAMASAQAGELFLKLPNFPRTLDRERDAYIETLEIAQDGKSLRGVVRVKNLAFEKWVAVRFTLDEWQTVSEVSADHLESMGPMSDRFVFSIRLQDMLTKIEEKTMFVAVRYTVGGREIWDNNGGANYRVEFAKKAAPKPSGLSNTIIASSTSSNRQTWSLANPGQQDDRMADLRRELDRLVQDDHDPSPLHANPRAFTEGSTSAFSNRYDFGNSLKMSSPRSTNALQPGSPPKPYTTTLVNGMPATVFPEPLKPSSPLPRTQPLLPDFGASFGKRPTYPPYAARSQHRPPSPPAEHDMASIYNAYKPYLPVAEPSPRSRHHSFPGGPSSAKPPHHHPSSHGGGIPPHYTPLQPPSFRAHRRNESPFASPAISPVPSPAMSPQSSSPQRSRSPPLYPTTSPEELWSPASSLGTLSTSASPESVQENPSLDGARPSGPSNFSSFLDRYCFHTSSAPSSLGLSGPAEGHNLPLADFATRRAPPSSASTLCGAFFAGSATSSVNGGSGASTPSRDEVPTPLDAFAGAFGGRGAPAIVG